MLHSNSYSSSSFFFFLQDWREVFIITLIYLSRSILFRDIDLSTKNNTLSTAAKKRKSAGQTVYLQQNKA
jgi:hypothetical protein